MCVAGAIIHDVDHPGRNSAYLCNSGSELAILYNDTTVLENHHSALGFKLTQSDKRVNILANLDSDVYKVVRSGLIDVVLATDMSKHFLHVNKFCSQHQVALESINHQPGNNDPVRSSSLSSLPGAVVSDGATVDTAVIKRMLMKCADVSNPARPREICKIWAERIAEEYFAQVRADSQRELLTSISYRLRRSRPEVSL